MADEGTATFVYEWDRTQKPRGKLVLALLSILLVLSLAGSSAARMGMLDFLPLTDGERQLSDWLVASATGTLLYLMLEAARAYRLGPTVPKRLMEPPVDAPRKVKDRFDEGRKAQEQADFVGWSPWYFLNCIRGPIIAIVVMLALTNVSFTSSLGGDSGAEGEVSTPQETEAPAPEAVSTLGVEAFETVAPTEVGPVQTTPTVESSEGAASEASSGSGVTEPVVLGVDLGNASPDVLLVVAFILGMFSRVGVAALETIGEKVFGPIWKKAFEDTPKQKKAAASGKE